MHKVGLGEPPTSAQQQFLCLATRDTTRSVSCSFSCTRAVRGFRVQEDTAEYGARDDADPKGMQRVVDELLEKVKFSGLDLCRRGGRAGEGVLALFGGFKILCCLCAEGFHLPVCLKKRTSIRWGEISMIFPS